MKPDRVCRVGHPVDRVVERRAHLIENAARSRLRLCLDGVQAIGDLLIERVSPYGDL